MTVVYHEGIETRVEEQALLERATKTLDEVLGRWGEGVKAEWERGLDAQGHDVFVLRLSDDYGSVLGVFAPDDLRAPQLRFQLNRLWMDLLQIRSRKLLQALTAAE